MDQSCYKNGEVIGEIRSEKIEVDVGEKYSCMWDLFFLIISMENGNLKKWKQERRNKCSSFNQY